MARRQAAALAGLGTNTLAALSPQVVALLLLSPAEFAVFSLLFVALGLVQSAQNSLVVDPWLRHDRESGRVDRKSTRLNSSHTDISRMPSSA